VLLLAIAAGILAGAAAAALHASLHFGAPLLIGRFTHLGGPQTLVFRPEIVALPALGCFLTSIAVWLALRRAPGHGTDELVRAFHHHEGRLALRTPVARATAAVAVISSGGSAGPEGPIASLGAAIGSKLGQWLALPPREQRTLLIAGCAAGVGAIFGCPLGGALFAAGILYRQPEFESRSLAAAFLAAAAGYSTFMALRGGTRLLAQADELSFASPLEIPAYLALGALSGATAIFLSLCMRGMRRLAPHLGPVWLRPLVGGLATGLLGCLLPQVMDGEYRVVQNALDGTLYGLPPHFVQWGRWALLFAAIAAAKCVATAFTLGSGAAGGVLGPSVFIGGVVGAGTGAGIEALWPGDFPVTLRQAMIPVGMAGVLSAAMRTPLASMVIVMEMTGSYGLIVPLMIVSMIAYMVGGRFGLIDDQVNSAAESPAHAGDAVIHQLESVRVAEVMRRDWPQRAKRETPLAELLRSVAGVGRPTVPVLDGERLVGLVSLDQIRRVLDEAGFVPDGVIAADLLLDDLYVASPEHTLYDVLGLFQRQQLDALPVVGPGGDVLAGMLTRADVYDVVRSHGLRDRDRLLHEHAELGVFEEEEKLARALAAAPSADASRVERLPVADELVGRSLRDADFRHTRGAWVLAVRARDGALRAPPDPARPLEAGDELYLLRSS
jgi:CIC family chloride channel protein